MTPLCACPNCERSKEIVSRVRREAAVERQAVVRAVARRRRLEQLASRGVRHGLTAYGRGCKCDVCREAKRRSNAERYPKGRVA